MTAAASGSRWPLAWLNRDGKTLLACRLLRTFGYGSLAVVLALALEQRGLDPFQVGLVLTAALAGSAAITVIWSLLADRYGRRKTVATMALAMAAGGLLFALTDTVWLLVLASFTGTISATSAEVGPFQTVEQAILPQTAPEERRTWLFAVYTMLGNFAGAAGSLFAGAFGALAPGALSGPHAYAPLFFLYAAIGLANFALFSTLSERVELAHVQGRRGLIGLHRSRGTVARLSLLFGLDAFAGGLVIQSLVAYWLHIRWGLSPATLGVVFFWVNVLSGLSLLAASWLARRVGLLNTMVFTHLPSNVLLMLVPLAPTAWLAVACFLARMSVSQMDVPTRQSYTMALVDPDERTATAGITTVARTAATALSPLVSSLAFGSSALALPFLLAGGLKIAYDLLLYATFRRVRPPEDTRSHLGERG
jgi:MFS family permease